LAGCHVCLGSSLLAIKGSEWYNLITGSPTPFAGLPESTFLVTTGVHAAHVLAGLLLILYVMRKASAGGFSAKNYGTVENIKLYWSFVSSVWLVVFALFYLI